MSRRNEARRVVVTGMGAITPIGLTLDDFWSAALDGKNGVGTITSFNVDQYDTKIAAEVKGFNPLNYMEKKETNRMDLFTQY
ncbi:MAG TPA: beta-ketoacyl synthase N-terminal-like domain-containing protein, partial [Bacteroidota bacterium]|nr:beta-ketoacyl synthase N-terminal-like domain-containing protein [Bacteroidota bacterium]